MSSRLTYEELVQRVKKLEKETSESKLEKNLSRIQRDLSMAFNSIDNLNDGLGLSLEAALKASGMDCGAVYLFDETSGTLDMVYDDGLPPDFVKETSRYESDSDNLKLVMAGEPIYTQHQKLDISLSETERQENLYAAGVIPISHHNQVIGCLNVASHSLEEVPFTSSNALEAIAAQIGGAILRLQAQENLSESEEKLRLIFENVNEEIVFLDSQGTYLDVNKKIEDIFGYKPEEVIGTNFTEIPFCHPDSSKNIIELFRKAAFGDFNNLIELKGIRKDGTEIDIELSTNTIKKDGEIKNIVAVVRDITERKRTHEIMIQTEKMMTVGGLAAGMAHEINNPLATIMQNVQIINSRMSDDIPKNRSVAEQCGTTLSSLKAYMDLREISDMLETVMESGKRIVKIVNNMLSFSRKSASIMKLYNLGELLDETIELAEKGYDLNKTYDFRQIDIVREYNSDVPKVPCEGSKIQQVALNILINGAQAMVEGSAHMIEDGLRKSEKESVHRFIIRVVPDGEMARIEIEDNGPGMDEETCKRVFEPFFTTKGDGVGTGLGLSVSYFIISEDHGGTITVDSTPGKGVKFIIRLPIERNVH